MIKRYSHSIRIGKSRIHNKGIFAKNDIKRKTLIIEYVGEKIIKAESERRSNATLKASKKDKSKGAEYIFHLDSEYDIDGNVPYNTARYINHSCEPNCEYYHKNSRIWIRAKKNIKKDEELTFNYGFDLEDSKNHPCKCGSPKCAGYILYGGYHKKSKK